MISEINIVIMSLYYNSMQVYDIKSTSLLKIYIKMNSLCKISKPIHIAKSISQWYSLYHNGKVMTKSIIWSLKYEIVYVIMVMSIWQLLHVHITMQHLYHSTCTTPHAPLVLCTVINYGTNHSFIVSGIAY